MIEGFREGAFTTPDDYFMADYPEGRYEDGFQNGVTYGHLRLYGKILELDADGRILYHKEKFVS